jgi:hypothetical protein
LNSELGVDQSEIFGPFLALLLLTLVVWIFMYVRRIGFIRRERIDTRRLEAPGELARLSPAAVSNPSDNLKNLFELPVLFYALALLLYVTDRVDGTYVVAAWAFVAFRFAHSLVHCTFNRVLVRFYCYLAGSLALWIMVLRAVYDYWLR